MKNDEDEENNLDDNIPDDVTQEQFNKIVLEFINNSSQCQESLNKMWDSLKNKNGNKS